MKLFEFGSSTRSAIAGAALATAVLLVIGAAQQSNPSTMRVIQDPHPDFIIRVMEGTPYVVPAGALLSVKSIGLTRDGGAGGGSSVVVKINGVDVLTGQADPTPCAFPIPVVASPGDVVTVEDFLADPNLQGVALGYLTRI